ncbi:hypothetical protein [Cryobacterium sp. M91]|uniref:hypothetical protein n=1 Tax=Cryobacterium sp. M91 TaxID=2048294 RepID=UPI001E6528E0|nr:hypothetical protein [Cryobacterium sp. M91]
MTLINDLRTTTRRSSDLRKHSADVFAEAEDHTVQITRRCGAEHQTEKSRNDG